MSPPPPLPLLAPLRMIIRWILLLLTKCVLPLTTDAGISVVVVVVVVRLLLSRHLVSPRLHQSKPFVHRTRLSRCSRPRSYRPSLSSVQLKVSRLCLGHFLIRGVLPGIPWLAFQG